jgi:phage terminase small subunit
MTCGGLSALPEARPLDQRPPFAVTPGSLTFEPWRQSVIDPTRKPPEPPAHLSPAACELWRSLLAGWDFHAADVLTLRGALEAWDLAQRARLELAAAHAVTVTAETGVSRQHPALKTFLDASRECRLALASLRLEIPEDAGTSWRGFVGGAAR